MSEPTLELDIYARAEDLLGIGDATKHLHAGYLQTLLQHEVKTFLDIGCGRGGLMEAAAEKGLSCRGIDLSPIMVEAARAKGLDVSCSDICDAEGSYDAAVAVFDVLNFIAPEALEHFMECVAAVLKPGGLFLADINTLHGFSNVAEGTMVAEDENRHLSVDARFDNNELHTCFTLFETKSDGCYVKYQDTLVQYFHPLKRLRKFQSLKLVEQQPLSLYDGNDKTFLIFRKPASV